MTPTICPPAGIGCFPVSPVEVRDGDTLVVQIRGLGTVWAIRLIDCWCKETNRGTEADKKLGRAAKAYVQQVIDAADLGDLRLWIPLPEVKPGDDVNLLKFLTFDRIPGYIFVGPSQTLNQMLISQGLASSTKEGALGK